MNQQILLIDDSDQVHPLVKAVLSKEPVDVHSALDPEFGITMAGSVQPDLILLDVDMPGMSGFDVAKRLKSMPETAHCPIIFLTGQSSPQKKVEGFGLGAIDYVTKPFNTSELLMRVRASLKTHRVIRRLEREALVDGLTGLWNRAMFQERISAELAMKARTGHPLTLMMIDVDNFKRVNDVYGHSTGDRVLKAIGDTIKGLCRKEDVACRYGGDEFVIILPNTKSDSAAVFGERLRQSVCKLRQQPAVDRGSVLASQVVEVTISIGIVDGGAEWHESTLITRADEALYAAKQNGRNTVAISRSESDAVSRAA